MLLVFVIALIGALLFSALSLPIPWLIGPIFSVLIAQFFIKDRLRWPAVLRNTGLVIVGVAIGQQFDFALFSDFKSLLFFMVIVNILLFAFCLGIAWIIARSTGLTFKTAVAANEDVVLGSRRQDRIQMRRDGDGGLVGVPREPREHISRTIHPSLPAEFAEPFRHPGRPLRFQERGGGHAAKLQMLFIDPGAFPAEPVQAGADLGTAG